MKKLPRASVLAVATAFLFFAAGCSAARKTGKAAALPVGPDHHAAAQAHLNSGNHEAAIESFTLAAEAHEDEKGEDHPDTIRAYIGLAKAHHLKGDHAKGAGFMTKAGGLLKNCISSLNPAAGTVLKEMCDLLKSRGKHKDAAEIYKESVAIMEKNSLGKHPAMADTLMHMAETYREQGLHGEAVEIFTKARSVVEKDYGRSHPQVARIMMGLAASHSANGDHKAGK
jgi:tetratricopeptide (TPR) repeat protein